MKAALLLSRESGSLETSTHEAALAAGNPDGQDGSTNRVVEAAPSNRSGTDLGQNLGRFRDASGTHSRAPLENALQIEAPLPGFESDAAGEPSVPLPS